MANAQQPGCGRRLPPRPNQAHLADDGWVRPNPNPHNVNQPIPLQQRGPHPLVQWRAAPPRMAQAPFPHGDFSVPPPPIGNLGGPPRLPGNAMQPQSSGPSRLNSSVASSQVAPVGFKPGSLLAKELGVSGSSTNLFQMIAMKKANATPYSVEVVDLLDDDAATQVDDDMDISGGEEPDESEEPVSLRTTPEAVMTVDNVDVEIEEIEITSVEVRETLADKVKVTSEDSEAAFAGMALSPTNSVTSTPTKTTFVARRAIDVEYEVITLSDSDSLDSEDSDDVICLDDDDEATTKSPSVSKSPKAAQPTAVVPMTLAEVLCTVATPARNGPRKVPKRTLVKPPLPDGLNTESLNRRIENIRFWRTLQESHGADNVAFEEVRVCSYNILCQDTIRKTIHLYGHLIGERRKVMEWEYRWKRLSAELKAIDADLYGLQEVQEDQFLSTLRPFFAKMGLKGYFKQRTGGMFIDGCAIFYNPRKFDVVDYRIVEYFVGPNTTMDKEQIGQMVLLKCKKTNELVLFANTHLLFNKNRGDIKIGQLAMLFANIYDMSKDKRCSVIITGDFNMEPYSSVYTYAANGHVYLRGLEQKLLSGQQKSRGGNVVVASNILPPTCNVRRDGMFAPSPKSRLNLDPDTFTHPFKLHSVYEHGAAANAEVSTHHTDSGNPDFIFYSVHSKSYNATELNVKETRRLRLMARYELPTLSTLRGLSKWPNEFVPSDHVPLIADFRLVGQPQTQPRI